jgi:hypothetical protein
MTDDSGQTTDFSYYADGQLAERIGNGIEEEFIWDGLALISRNETKYSVEPHVNGGSPIMADGKVIFNDMLGSSLGTVENGEFCEIRRTSFGDQLSNSSTPELSNFSADFFTGKPSVEGLGYSFLFRNYRSDLGKWQKWNTNAEMDQQAREGIMTYHGTNFDITDHNCWTGVRDSLKDAQVNLSVPLTTAPNENFARNINQGVVNAYNWNDTTLSIPE